MKLSGEMGPFVLAPHSMSGLEALYWAQQYPEEVKAIVGLDPVTPESVEVMGNLPKAGLSFMYALARTGLTRWIQEADIGQQLPVFMEEAQDLLDELKGKTSRSVISIGSFP